jgi:GNAT superfamily N-acetyltransferase
MNDIKIELFNESDIDELYLFITDTVKTSYLGYYPPEAIDFFIEYSNKEEIIEDAKKYYVIVVKDTNKIIATGTLKYTHIKRVYVSPTYQGKGIGKLIMNHLEEKVRNNNLKIVELHSSLFAISFYKDLNYKTLKNASVEVENGKLLYYQRMAKRLSEDVYTTNYNFHEKRFKVVKNDGEDAEVNTETVFDFLQNNELIYAEYTGGKVRYGELFGVIENDTIYFYYNQENIAGQKNQGSSKDIIKMLDNNKLQLIDRWEWQSKNGQGECLLQES